MNRAGRLRRWPRIAFALALLVSLGGAAAWFLPDLIGGPARRGRSAYARGRYAEAEALARQALKERSGDLDARRLLARSLARQNRDGQAIPIFQGLGMEGLESEDLYLIGAAMLRRGVIDNAIAALETARDADPNHAEAVEELLRFYESDDRLVEALPVARNLAQIKGKAAPGWVAVARLSEALDDPEGAYQAWDKALSADPGLRGTSIDPAEGRRNAARQALRLGKPDDARRHLIGDSSREGSWLGSRAAIQLGRWEEAKTALDRAGGPSAHSPLDSEPSPYVGSAKCAECHDGINSVQQSSRHARTFRTGAELGQIELPATAIPDPARTDVVHDFRRRQGGGLAVETRTPREPGYQALVDYAFGSGDRGLTLVGHDREGTAREIRLSHYGDGDHWGLTFGQNPHPSDPRDLIGRPLTADGVRRCVKCHVTRPSLGVDRSGPEAADRSIGCERCHGPGGNHVKAVEAEFADLAIGRPKGTVGPPIVKLCGTCHTTATEPKPDQPAVVRFQATTLTWSKCYKESLGKLDCVTCHDPHRNAVATPSHYEDRCLACHSPKGTPTIDLGSRAPDDRMSRVVCSVNPKSGCVACHMPQDAGSVPHSPFTDHQISIHHAPATPVHGTGAR